MNTLKQQWFGNISRDVLSGMVIALALIPESIAFSILAGVDPKVGLYASFIIAVSIAFVGGRPAMISAATGAMALVFVSLVKDHGLQYLLAATILTGFIQILFGILKIAKLMSFVPNAVMLGFVNSLAILVFMAQMPHLIGANITTFIFTGITLILVYVLPKLIKSIPAPLIAIVFLSAISIYYGADLKTVGDMGIIPQSLPTFLFPDVPLNLETLQIVLPYSIALAIVGLMESLLTASLLDDMTETKSDKNKEARGQGIANVINGFFGGMAGCAMIGQSVMNVRSGGRGRLSTFVAGAFLIFLILVLGRFVVEIPMAVLVGIMIMVSISSFDWGSFKFAMSAPRKEVAVMLVTVAIVLYTHNLAIGVVAGVILSALFFISGIAKLDISTEDNHYTVNGPLFFASTERFMNAFEQVSETNIVIDFTNSQLWDESAVGSLLKVTSRLQAQGTHVEIVGLNPASQKLYHQLLNISTNH